MSVSDWVTQLPFTIAEVGAARPGPYDLAWTPWWREPMDAWGDPEVRHINIVASAQTGKTQLGNACVAYTAAVDPGNMLYVRPTESDVAEAFRDRFKPMIEANLRDLVPIRGEWMKITDNPVIVLASMLIYGAAASIERQLTSRTTPKIIYDETDSAGDAANLLGNILDVIDERQMAISAMRSITMGMSTPRLETGSNYNAYETASDRRRYCEPCPLCGWFQALKMSSIKSIDGERDPLVIRRERLGHYQCSSCKGMIHQDHQGWMSDRGIWVPHCQKVATRLPLDDDDIRDHQSLAIADKAIRWEPRLSGEPPNNPHRGYHVWRANTKFDQCNWSNILARFFEVNKTKDPAKLQVFLNNWLAQPWKESTPPADEDMISKRIGAYPSRNVPARAKVILGAVDVQKDCIWFGFRAFGANQRSWLIQYGTIEVSNQNYAATFDAVYKMAFKTGWPIMQSSSDMMRAYAIAVDSGYRTDEVYEFARRECVIATRGQDVAVYRVRASVVEGKATGKPLTLYNNNTKVFKDRLQRLIRTGNGDVGEWNLHSGTTQEYIGHLAAEHLISKTKGSKIKVWKPKTEGKPNHMLDVEAMILGLGEALEQRREISLMAIEDTDPQYGVFTRGQDPLEPPPQENKPAPKAPPQLDGNWIEDGGP
jgi:phage terminase large subunit GpA-like protein